MSLYIISNMLLLITLVCATATYLFFKKQGKNNFVYGLGIVTIIVLVVFGCVGLTVHQKNSKYINAYNDLKKHAKKINDIGEYGYSRGTQKDRQEGIEYRFKDMDRDIDTMKNNDTGKYDLLGKAKDKQNDANENFENSEMPMESPFSTGNF
ncbi:hypothetical protein [Limosilactobacillus ingluviei]|uniref:hypothetical protein n=1 Tax=Limosilactobacillus ingluviei TaxID=148604 RepID=UPI000593DC96|nr:hypothetical protein [Limosilactobacillus ingluviei]